ncbi:MAG TPA: DUF4198 domain-containing protein [Candidatus Krumholzibacteria bacterium]
MKTWMLAAAVTALAATAASAHDTWIMCTPPAIKSGAAVTLHITSGMKFPEYETAPDAARIEKCEWRIGGRRGTLDEFKKGETSLTVTGRVSTDGVAVIYAEFLPKEIDLAPAEVEEYMEEIGAPESVRKAWTDAGPDATFHETYRKHARTYLRVGDSGDATGCLGPVGFNIDFLPDRDPTSVKVGETLTIKVIRGGDELSGFSVGAVRGGKTSMQRTNQNGMVTLSIDTAGWWLVRGTELRRNADGTWESDFTTLTFFVANH